MDREFLGTIKTARRHPLRGFIRCPTKTPTKPIECCAPGFWGGGVRRREFITFIGGALSARPFAARAQQDKEMRRVGVLMQVGDNDTEAQARIKVLQEALQQLGWSNGRNIRFEYRWADGKDDSAQQFAKELVELGLDAIVGQGTISARALQRATQTIPVVFVQVTNPVAAGFITSLAHPAGNITGFSMYEPDIGTKWVQILKEIAPGVARVAVLFNPETAPGRGVYFERAIEAASPALALKPFAVPVHDAAEIERAIDAIAQEPNAGLVVPPDATTYVHKELVVRLTEERRIPAIFSQRFFAAAGGLVCYGVDTAELFRQAAAYVDRILRGAKPSDLPVQAPTKFELIINIKTAKTLGLTVPPTLLASADEVIE
jgi:putative ABC transport system substrate-binding protein